MYQFFVDSDKINTETHRVFITGQDVKHIKNVLRMKPGDEISIKSGEDAREYRCGILNIEEEMVTCELRFVREEGVELPSRVYLFQALPKADKMELIIQKAVELGVYEIIPVASKRCVVRLDDKRAKNKTTRWQQIAEAAAKQSRRGIIPRVNEVMTFTQALEYAALIDIRLIPYELADDMDKTKEIIGGLKPGQSIAVFIGPEGGFDGKEAAQAVAAGIVPVTLGKRILRTETAGFTVLSWIMYQLEG